MASQAAAVAEAPVHAPQHQVAETSGNGDSNTSSGRNSDLDEKHPHPADLRHIGTNETANTTYTTFDATGEAGMLFKDGGELVLMPAPTKDPRDPLNLPMWKKVVGLTFLCCFGALAASAELILGAMLPVFALEYAGQNPKILKYITDQGGFIRGTDPLETLQYFPNAPPIWKTYLIGSMPILVIGLSNLVLIPAAISVGRRPIVIICGFIAMGGALWAGFSQSLGSHIGGRCLQAFGAGTVESLIPFIIQDMVYIHQRNTAISGVFAAQGTIIIALGIAAPYCIINLTWRWIYFITTAGAAFFLVGVYFFMPETRWHRTKAELNGIPRPPHHERDIKPRTWRYDLALRHGKIEHRKGWNAFLDSLRTFFYPHVFFITMLNSAMIACAFAAGFTVSPALLTSPYKWPFLNVGLCLIPVLIAAIAVGGVTGKFADVVANYFAKKRGRRLPENQLINLILPTIAGLVGTVIFGLAGEHEDGYHWAVFLLGLGLMAFGFLGANTVGAVYVLECYPQLAGPALVNIASFRCIFAFAFSFKVSEWVVDFGYLKSMIIYTALIGFLACFIPVIYIWGPAWRRRWPGPDR